MREDFTSYCHINTLSLDHVLIANEIFDKPQHTCVYMHRLASVFTGWEKYCKQLISREDFFVIGDILSENNFSQKSSNNHIQGLYTYLETIHTKKTYPKNTHIIVDYVLYQYAYHHFGNQRDILCKNLNEHDTYILFS